MKTVKIGQLTIGKGMPKTCVPIVGKDRHGIEQAMKGIWNCKHRPDLVEFRADWFEGVEDISRVHTILGQIKAALGEVPLLFTFRTGMEGGERIFEYEAYERLLLSVAESRLADAVDVEAFSYINVQKASEGQVCQLVKRVQEEGCAVVGSNHDFHATPAREEIVRRLRKMQEMGMDIAKVAVMPNNAQDVLELLSATAEASADEAMCPIITMSMSGQGLISRLSGEVFGSSVTFASVGMASAPGQIALDTLQELLRIIHESQ